MRITVLGTGVVGRTLAANLAGLGHDVVVGTRDPDRTLARSEPDQRGNPPYSAWAAEHPGVGLAAYAASVAEADVVLNATSGGATEEVLAAIGAELLAGRVLLDLSNPLDLSAGWPPTLFVKDDDSLGERLQRAYPATRVVKSLNTLNVELMVQPDLLGEPSTVFVSGDDAEAKATVTQLLTDLGHRDILDLGGIETSRGVEMYFTLWRQTGAALGTARFNLRVVR
ncbi:NAD(P)-binding domain-containing protein [Nocardioides fonticola]|uniref:NAD(P)-binding domain-containing protein n=1 Tax=Nocardioides fonticola TaxID=450363 RepID=A0ABP7XA12_9ACTN